MTTRSTLAALCSLVLGLNSASFADPAKLAGSTWTLKSWTEKGTVTSVKAKVTLSFNKERFSGIAAINHYSGKYKAGPKANLQLGEMMTTEMGGPPHLMKLESRYLQFLGKMSTFAISEGTLTLTDGTEKNQLQFSAPKPVADQPLQGTLWTLTAFGSGQGDAATVTSVIKGTTITLKLEDGGRVGGSSGVNRYFGKAETGEEGEISFGGMASTRRAGPPQHMKQESAYLKSLAEMVNYKISGNSLVLQNKDNSAQLYFVAKE